MSDDFAPSFAAGLPDRPSLLPKRHAAMAATAAGSALRRRHVRNAEIKAAAPRNKPPLSADRF
jgi:hypothetical protein